MQGVEEAFEAPVGGWGQEATLPEDTLEEGSLPACTRKEPRAGRGVAALLSSSHTSVNLFRYSGHDTCAPFFNASGYCCFR